MLLFLTFDQILWINKINIRNECVITNDWSYFYFFFCVFNPKIGITTPILHSDPISRFFFKLLKDLNFASFFIYPILY